MPRRIKKKEKPNRSKDRKLIYQKKLDHKRFKFNMRINENIGEITSIKSNKRKKKDRLNYDRKN